MSDFRTGIKVIRSRRKTVELRITPDAVLIVRVPVFISNADIEKIILKHSEWIEKNLKIAEKRNSEVPDKKFVSGEKFLYLGKHYTLEIVKNQLEPLVFNGRFLLSEKSVPNAKQEFVKWYKKAAFEILSERVKYFSEISRLSFNKVGITNAKKRWGSCSRKKNLNFSYRLVMAPLPIIDYVVVHELAHTVQMNHSKKFWEIVRNILPNFTDRRNWLKENGYKLKI